MKKMLARTWTAKDAGGCEFNATMWQDSDGSRTYACKELDIRASTLAELKDKVSKWGR
jgi:hypothetical protein